MTVYELAQYLVTVPGTQRADAIRELVPGMRAQSFRASRRRQGLNLTIGDDRPRLVLGAHYDIDPGTTQGAIDNTAAVAVLADLAMGWSRDGFPAGLQICFWDLEEPGNGGFADGSEAYARVLQFEGVRPDLAVVCDVLGIGVPWLSYRSDPVAAYLVRRVFGALDLPADGLGTPGSDDAGLRRAGIPSALLTTLPADRNRDLWRVMHTEDDTIELVRPDSLAMCRLGLNGLVEEYLSRGVSIADLRDDPDFAEALAERVARERPRRPPLAPVHGYGVQLGQSARRESRGRTSPPAEDSTQLSLLKDPRPATPPAPRRRSGR